METAINFGFVLLIILVAVVFGRKKPLLGLTIGSVLTLLLLPLPKAMHRDFTY